MILERVVQQLQRIRGIPWYEVLLELLLIGVVVYLIVRFLRGTRGAGVIKGIVLILVVTTLFISIFARDTALERLTFLYNNLLGTISLAMIIIFQPELRRGLVRLGEARIFSTGGIRQKQVIDAIISAVVYLSRNKIGALIAIERQVGLSGVVESGTRLDAAVSKELLSTLFWPGSALHDMGVVIRGDRVVAAGVQFPLAEGEHVSPELGSRHRAAIGLSQEVDALIIVVSEESGIISVAERGELTRHLSIEDLRNRLEKGLGKTRSSIETDMNIGNETDANSSGAS